MLNARDKTLWTPLYRAAQKGFVDIGESLLKQYGLTNLVPSRGKGHKDIVKLILDNSADINVTDNAGRTPLYWAKQKGHKEIAELLRKHRSKE